MVTWSYSLQLYLDSGWRDYLAMRGACQAAGVSLPTGFNVLDFGCGCGRMLRHWPSGFRMCGADYNPKLLQWCAEVFPDYEFILNEGRLSWRDGRFDFAYCWSVFTHLGISRKNVWMRELHRVIRPGGFLFATIKGERALRSEMHREFGGVFWEQSHGQLEGTNICATYYSPEYMLSFADGWKVIYAKEPSDHEHDYYIFQRME